MSTHGIGCPECGWTGTTDDVTIGNIEFIAERVTPGELAPAGQCPNCNALIEADAEMLQAHTIAFVLSVAKDRPGNSHRTMIDALKAMHTKYGALHDALSEIVEGGTLESSRPELQTKLADMLVDCLAADKQATDALALVEQPEPEHEPEEEPGKCRNCNVSLIFDGDTSDLCHNCLIRGA